MIDYNALSAYEREIVSMRKDSEFTDEHMIVSCALGLAGEAGEVHDAECVMDPRKPDAAARAKFVAELGDVLWYTTTAANRLGVTMADAFALGDAFPMHGSKGLCVELLLCASRFAEAAKKAVLHERGIATMRDGMLDNLGAVLRIVYNLGLCYAIEPREVEAANVAKLRARYPSGGYTAAEANARADEAKG